MNIDSFSKFRINEDSEKILWDNCFFVFDSSALLDFYFYPIQTQNDIYSDIFEKVQDRLWIPSHVQFEYLKNRESVIKKPINENYKQLDPILKSIAESGDQVLKRIEELKERTKNINKHPHLTHEDIVIFEAVLKAYNIGLVEFDKNIKIRIEDRQNQILKLEKEDTVLENFKKYFKVGREYSFDEIMEITKEGKHRFEFDIPPGYEDLKKEKKEGTQIFGDLIVWKQIIEFAKENKTSIVLICNDLKADWWNLDKDKRIKWPREELIKEFSDSTGKDFWMYSQEQFVFTSNKLLKSTIDRQQIQEILEVIVTPEKPELKIIESRYYTSKVAIDITAKLQSLVKDNSLRTLANNELVGDPDVGTAKKLYLKYSIGKDIYQREYDEHGTIAITGNI